MIHYSLFGTDQTLPFVACEKILDEQPMREPAVVAVMCREKATHRKGRILYAEQTWPIYFKKGLSLKVAIVDVPWDLGKISSVYHNGLQELMDCQTEEFPCWPHRIRLLNGSSFLKSFTIDSGS